MYTIVTHNRNFHVDDVFAVATLQLYLGVENVQVVRSREKAVIEAADWVVDVGEVYDPAHRRFDHHQLGAPVRDNGIPYAAFGLVWKEIGEAVSGSALVAEAIEGYLVQPVDAGDAGISLCVVNGHGVSPYELFNVVYSFKPVWGSEESMDEAFLNAVNFARELLKRRIAHDLAKVVREQLVEQVYEAAIDKQLIVTTEDVSVRAFAKYPEVLLVVVSGESDAPARWVAGAVPVTVDSFDSRVLFPIEWAGLSGIELQAVSGISGATFCHKSRHLFVADSREGAEAAARIVLANLAEGK